MSKHTSIHELLDLQKANPTQFKELHGFTWHHLSILGKGAFGQVFLGFRNADKELVAIKVVSKEVLSLEQRVKVFLEREIKIMLTLIGSSYIVQLFHQEECSFGIVLIMELCDSDLEKFLVHNKVTQLLILRFLKQLSVAINAMHMTGIVHRDLKPANILIKYIGDKNYLFDIRLADFGYSRFFRTENPEGIQKIDLLSSAAGTPVYMAPEALACVVEGSCHYTEKVDIWSAGAILYRFIVGEHGFFHRREMNMQELLNVIRKKGNAIGVVVNQKGKAVYIKELPDAMDDVLSIEVKLSLSNLLQNMLQVDYQLRLSTSRFLELVDDITLTKFEVCLVHNGCISKFPVSSSLSIDAIKSTFMCNFSELCNTDFFLLYNSIDDINNISTSEKLQIFTDFHLSVRKEFLFVIIGKFLSDLEPPSVENLFEPLTNLFSSKSKKDLKRDNNLNLIPQISKRIIDQLIFSRKLQLEGYQSFLSFSINLKTDVKNSIDLFESHFKVFESKVHKYCQNIIHFISQLQGNQFSKESTFLKEYEEEFQMILSKIISEYKQIQCSYEKDCQSALEIFKKSKDIKADDISECSTLIRELPKYPIDLQIETSEEFFHKLSNNIREFNMKLHFKLSALYKTVNFFVTTKNSINLLLKQLLNENTIHIDQLFDKYQSVIIRLFIPQNEKSCNQIQVLDFQKIQEEKQLIELHKEQLSEKLFLQINSLKYSEELNKRLYNYVIKFNKCYQDLAKLLELDFNDSSEQEYHFDEFKHEENFIHKDIRKALFESSKCNFELIRKEIMSIKTKSISLEKDKISITNIHSGDQILLLPSKSLTNSKVHVPRVFTTELDEMYFLDTECYSAFELTVGKDFTGFRTGYCNEEPSLNTAKLKLHYPVKTFGSNFYTVKAKPSIRY